MRSAGELFRATEGFSFSSSAFPRSSSSSSPLLPSLPSAFLPLLVFSCEAGFSPFSFKTCPPPHTATPVANMSGRVPKQSMSELKLRRLSEHNQRLREDLARPRIRVSEASKR